LKVHTGLAVVVVLVMVIFAFVAGESIPRPVTTTVTVTSVITESSLTLTSVDNTFTWDFPLSVLVSYDGPWNLTYWGENGTATQSNFKTNVGGSGEIEFIITLSGVGYIERTLCANATRLDSEGNVQLTLTVVTRSNSTTASDPSAEVCATVAP
jgi:hypothetical protein